VVQDFSQASASNVVLGDKFNQTVEEICKMGFPKEDTIKALKAAFNNPDRAIDYLINVRTYRKNLS
jgi:UV excision repair protein RAD23